MLETGKAGQRSGHPDLLEAFARSVARRPDHAAVEAPDGSYSLRALDVLANRLANRLRALGVERESTVGISLPRGALELGAMLATLKAGGAYVPLDPGLPLDRLRTILEDARPEVLLVHPDSPLAELSPARLLRIADLESSAAGFQDAPPAGSVTPDQLAYLLFTSGSTGRPKGVEITRDAFSNFLGSMAHTPGLSENDRLLAVTTTSFDIAGLELFLPLCVGATTVIVDRETARDPRLLRRRLETSDISVLQATPATWRLLLESGWRGDRRLKMLCGGEALSPTLAERLLAAGGELWNVYGPTETTVWSSIARIAPGQDRITIGTPIDETRIYVLDDARQLVPVGQEGELWIGGRGLARGYRGRPDLTAERFVPDPHGGPGARMYRTGDLGRQLPDGRFDCLGRVDHQVKIRGFRVELGEIETTLRSVPAVADVLVVAERQDTDPRLVAYWCGGATRDALIAAARQHLPDYMVPAAYVHLDSFPLNSNGKIDRKRLPRPEAAAIEPEERSLPRSDAETRIAAVWAEALGLPAVPVDESFFTLGGTSALAVEVVARLEQELKIPVSMQAFFETPTVEAIAAKLGTAVSRTDSIVVRLARGGPGVAPLFCLFGVHLYQDFAVTLSAHGDYPVVGMHIPFFYVPGVDTPPTLREVGRRYVDLIRSHQADGPYRLLGLCFGGIVAYEVARQLEEAGQAVAAVTIVDAVLPGAVHVNRLRQLRRHLEGARREPRAAARRLIDKAGRTTLPLLARIRRLARSTEPHHAIELPFDGPEVDAEVRRFAQERVRLATRLLVVRAIEPPPPDWISVDLDHGWQGRASEVIIHDIPASHLDVLRLPHARAFARAVAQLTGS